MKKYSLDGKKMTTREDAYAHIARELGAPEYFGKNLDALYDILSETQGEITLKNADDLINSLGGYGCDIIKCFCDAACEFASLSFTVK